MHSLKVIGFREKREEIINGIIYNTWVISSCLANIQVSKQVILWWWNITLADETDQVAYQFMAWFLSMIELALYFALFWLL